ncbi:MAG TPA: TPM domain-containing protein [Pyrinomonadaceae bacterium]
MVPSYRLISRLLTLITAVALFLLICVNPLAQSNKLPAPGSYVSDFAGVIDSATKTRLEDFLQKLKEKSNFELYVATVESTGDKEISKFSQQLATDWNIGAKTTRTKSLLLVVSTGAKTSFMQFSRSAQTALPDGILGEVSYRMSGPLNDGRFGDAVDSGIHVLAIAVAEKIGFNVSELETSAVASNSPEVTATSEPVLVSAKTSRTRPRVVSEAAKAEATPPADPPAEPTPTETPSAEPTSSESPKTEPVVTESPETEVVTPPKKEPATNSRRKPTAKTTPVVKKTAEEIAEQDADESEEVELTLTKPLPERAVKLKEFLDTHPESKARPRAIELLISTHAAMGDQKLKNGDTVGGIEQLLHAIEEADVNISEQLFSGVIAQIPTNLYMRGEREAAFKAAQNVETKFGADPKRLLAIAGFYLSIERANDTVRLAESAVKLAPDLAEAHRMLAVGLHISLRLDEAIAEYKRTLELDPTSKVSRGSLADLYRASGKTEEALTLYNEQLAADPKDNAARAGKVISLLELKRTDEANSALEAALADIPRNLPLLAGTAYWYAAHDNHEKAFEFARKAIEIEPRYTWTQIALARALLGMKRPLDAERALRFARQFGKFPTLSYELANVLSSMGLYDEAVEVLRESFTMKDGQIQTYLAGHVSATDANFIDLLAPERRAGIYQPTSADNAANAKKLKALLALNTITTPTDGEKINETAAVAAAKEFASGSDSMHAFRKVYAASRLVRNGVGNDTAMDLVAAARTAADEALKLPAATMAVQAEEFRSLRARAISAGNVPDVAPAPAEVLANIYKGRLVDIEGWALFNQEKYSEAITRLKQATEIAPPQTPTWRTALWHLGAALEQSGQKEQALEAYIKSYRGGSVESVRRTIIEQLYKSINGSLDGLDERLGGIAAVKNAPAPTPTPETTTTPAPPVLTSDPPPAETPTSEASPTPDPAPSQSPPQQMSEEELRAAAARGRTNIRITGRVVDANQEGLANATVVLITPTGTVIGATTDNKGNYSFKVAPSQKTYRVIPSKEGYTFTPIDRTLNGLFEDLRQIDFVGSKP